MTRGIDRNRYDPASPKANSHWARLYAAKRREIDIALLKELERELPKVVDEPTLNKFTEHMDGWIDDDIKTTIAKAFGRPP